MKNKKATAKMILLAFLLSLVLPAGAFAQSTASDVSGHWAESAITSWLDGGLIAGYEDGTFQPDKSITRAEFVKLINKAIAAQNVGSVDFADVTTDDWFYGELALAMGAGYCDGFTDGTFRPADTVTRAQAAAFIAKAKALADNSLAASRFTDGYAIPDWAMGAIGAVADAGYMSGYEGGAFGPDKALTRAEAVATLERVRHGAAPAGDDVTITAAGTLLSDKTVAGDLIIAASVGNGNVTLDNVTIKGDLLVQGGGSNSIHLIGCDITGTVRVEKTGVRVSFEGDTTAGAVTVAAAATLDAKSFTGSLGNVTITSGVTASQTVTIKVPVNNMTIDSKGTVNIQSTVTNVTVNQPAKIIGTGKIDTLAANVSGISTQIQATTVDKAAGVKDPVIITGGGVSGGGSSSGGDSGGSGDSGGGTTDPTPSTAITVTDALGLTKALANPAWKTITVSGTIGGSEAYGLYQVNAGVTVQGQDASATVYGSFVANGSAAIKNLHIINQGGDHPHRNAINVIGKSAAITGNTLTRGNNAVVGNGIVIWPTNDAAGTLTITGNTIENYAEPEGATTTSVGILAAENVDVNASYASGMTTETLGLDSAAEKAIATSNTYSDCQVDYSRSDFAAGSLKRFVVVDQAASLAELLAPENYLAENSTVMLNADITMDAHLVIPTTMAEGITIDGNGHTLTFADGKGPDGVNSGVVIQKDKTTLKDLSVTMGKASGEWSSCYAIQAYAVSGVVLEDITATGADGGILINGATATLQGAIDVSGNLFGGIEVGQGSDLTTKGALTIASSAAITNASEAYAKPTVWIESEKGTLTGGKFTSSIAAKEGQTQYYLIAANAADPDAEAATPEEEPAPTDAADKGDNTPVKTPADDKQSAAPVVGEEHTTDTPIAEESAAE